MIRSATGSPFLERQPAHKLTNLDPAATREALEAPLLDAGRDITPPALDTIAEASDGYPYAIQVVGEAAWDVGGAADTITIDHTGEAVEMMFATLEEQLYASRWEELSDKQQQYVVLAARMLTERGASTPAIAAELGGTTYQASSTRQELLDVHHILHMTGRSYVEFSIPGFDKWVRKNFDHTAIGRGAARNWRTELDARDLDRTHTMPRHTHRYGR